MKQVSVIGSGNVGANCAFFIAENRAASVLLVDVKQGLSTGSPDLASGADPRHYDTAIRGADDILGNSRQRRGCYCCGKSAQTG